MRKGEREEIEDYRIRLEAEQLGARIRAQLREIAETKLPDLNTNDIDSAIMQIAGTARSMGIEVRD